MNSPPGPGPTPPTVVRIEALAAGGRGIARPDGGKVWFVRGGLPGDLVEAQIERERSSLVEARSVALLEPGPLRRIPPCELQPRCGGCPWMPLPLAEQRVWKQGIVGDALLRIARLGGVVAAPIAGAERELGWRNRVEFSIGADEQGRPVIGLYRADGHGLLDVPRCPLLDEPGNRLLAAARAELLPLLRAGGPPGERARLIVRASAAGETLLVLRESRPWGGDLREAARRLVDAVPGLAGVVRVRQHPGRRGGAQTEVLAGRGTLIERLCGVKFQLPAVTFVQVHHEAAERLAAVVGRLAGEVSGCDVIDLYGGVGTHGFALAAAGARVTVADADGNAVACGKEAAVRAARGGIAFVQADALRFLERECAAGRTADLVVANPPRAGLGRGVAAALGRLAPPRIVLVSCDPATLARDLRSLVDSGYRGEAVEPLDLFPQTAHTEAVALLVREKNEPAAKQGTETL